MPNLEFLHVSRMTEHGWFVYPDKHSWPSKLHTVEFIRTGLNDEMGNEVLKSVDISHNTLNSEYPLVLGKNIETLKLRDMLLDDVPPAVFYLTARTPRHGR